MPKKRRRQLPIATLAFEALTEERTDGRGLNGHAPTLDEMPVFEEWCYARWRETGVEVAPEVVQDFSFCVWRTLWLTFKQANIPVIPLAMVSDPDETRAYE